MLKHLELPSLLNWAKQKYWTIGFRQGHGSHKLGHGAKNVVHDANLSNPTGSEMWSGSSGIKYRNNTSVVSLLPKVLLWYLCGTAFLGTASHVISPPLIPWNLQQEKKQTISQLFADLFTPKKNRASVNLDWKQSLMRWTYTNWRGEMQPYKLYQERPCESGWFFRPGASAGPFPRPVASGWLFHRRWLQQKSEKYSSPPGDAPLLDHLEDPPCIYCYYKNIEWYRHIQAGSRCWSLLQKTVHKQSRQVTDTLSVVQLHAVFIPRFPPLCLLQFSWTSTSKRHMHVLVFVDILSRQILVWYTSYNVYMIWYMRVYTAQLVIAMKSATAKWASVLLLSHGLQHLHCPCALSCRSQTGPGLPKA